MIVVDASAVLELLLRTPAADRVAERVLAPTETLHAPHLVDLEVAQVVRRYVRSGEIDEPRGAVALADLGDLPIRRYRHDIFLSRIWELRGAVTAFDAAYLALSEALSAPLITRDARLASAPGHEATVELI
ncbi:MAG: type II toxin-antitoxin system VapC family toxin [Acidobacteriota bacterium]|nr:type II toxin-antitoxin system VapC family toxin [Acidobacteriota bacterium]